MRDKLMKELVVEEATNLRKNAKQSELNKLNFDNLHSTDQQLCIYGQMTGTCFSDRTTELIQTSCKRVYKSGRGAIGNSKLNGNPTEENRDNYWSPIEVFIDKNENQTNGNNELLVKFLKGEINELKFK